MKKIMFALLFSIFMLSALTVPSMSQDVTVAVSVGDWFMYEGTLVEYEADEGVPFPPNEYTQELYTYNETDWQKYTVTDVAGSNVTFEVLSHWKNGTETTYELELNITSSFGPSEALTVVQPNLEAGDQLREGYDFFVWPVPPRIINETIMFEYELGSRETNVLDWYFPVDLWAPEGAFVNNKLLWDKETGVLVKYEQITNGTAQSATDWYFSIIRNELVDSSIAALVIPEFPTGTVMLLIFIAVTVCVDIYRRKKLKRQIG